MFYWRISIPLVKFIKTTSGTRVVYFHNLTREFIDNVISVISLYYFIDVSVYIITAAGRYEFYFVVAKTIFYSLAALLRKILFCHSKIKFISSRHRVISSIYITSIFRVIHS